MCKRIIPFTFSLLFVVATMAQDFARVKFTAPHGTVATSRIPCDDNQLGDISGFGPIVSVDGGPGMSTSVPMANGVTFLCFGDQFSITYDDTNLQLDGDPNPATPGGVAYIAYNRDPNSPRVEDGPDIATILNDNSVLLGNPTDVQSIVFAADLLLNGNETFENIVFPNGQTLQETFNQNGEPLQIWFAPISVDSYNSATDEVIYEGTPAGECVTVDLDEAFSVVYLNPVEFVTNAAGLDIIYPFGGDGSKARFQVNGGVPEFASAENYTITITNVDDPSILGEVANGQISAGSFPEISVPVPGTYNIQISDGQGCAVEQTLVMDQFTVDNSGLEFSIEGSSVVSLNSPQECVNITSENFDDIVGATIIINWDTSFVDSVFFLPGSDIESPPAGSGRNEWTINTSENEAIALLFSADVSGGTTLPSDSTLFTLCFTPKAATDCAIFQFVERGEGGTTREIVGTASLPITLPEDAFNEHKFEIIDPDRLTPVISEIRDACINEDNGSLDVQILGGTPPFEITISNVDPTIPFVDGPQTIFTNDTILSFIDLPAGNYEIFASEPNTGSFTTEPVEIRSATLGVNGVPVSTPICNADSNGVMQAQVALDGVLLTDLSTYTFIWINPAGDTIPGENEAIISGLPAGSYEVIAISNNGCSASDPGAFLTQPAEISVNPIPDDPSCSGIPDGSLDISNVVGGVGPFTFAWSDGNDQGLNDNIASGNYIYTITDAGGCPFRDSILLEAENEFSVSIDEIVPVQCFGFEDGRISINRSIDRGTGATGNFNFMWSDNVDLANITGVNNISSIADSLAAGTYSVTITNDALPGCEAEETFELIDPDSLLIENIDITNVSSCSLVNPDGGAVATVTGGTIAVDYQFTWQDTMAMTLGSANEIMGQESGIITLTVEDDNGCITTKDTIIGTPPAPIIDFFDADEIGCATDSDGALQVIAVPGRAGVLPLSFEWSHDPNLTTNVADNLMPGEFIVTVTDADGCISTAISAVTAPDIIRTDTVMFLETPCFGVEDGMLSVTLAGGEVANAYQIAWTALGENDVLSTDSLLSNIASGDYLLSVEDDNGCAFDTTITLNSLPRIVVTFDTANVTGVLCFDMANQAACDGFAGASAEYEGTGGGAFTFTWLSNNETSGMTTDMFSSGNLCAGMQALMVSDADCEVIDSVNIPSPDRLELDSINSMLSPASCFGDDNGIAELVAIGGVGNYEFEWPDGSTLENRMDLIADVYEISITDGNDCEAIQQIEITQPTAALMASIDSANTNGVVCQGDADGLITVLVTGGNMDGPLTYTWTDNVSTGSSAAGLAPNNYIIIVEDSEGCMDDTNFEVEEPAAITAQIDFQPIQCFGFQTSIGISSPMGGNGNEYSFSIDNSPVRLAGEFITDFGGDKLVSLFDATGCRVDTMVTIPQPRELLVGFAENIVEVDLGSEISIDLLIDGGVPVADIFWQQDGGPVSDTVFACFELPCDNPIVNPLDNTTFTAFVTDANGCMAEASITVDVDKNRNVFIPNVFAPNNSGFDTNDLFGIFTGSGVRQINFAQVYNRWGALVADVPFTPVDGIGEFIQVWDGFLKGEEANQGTYVYIIEVEFIDDEVLLYRGDVALLR